MVNAQTKVLAIGLGVLGGVYILNPTAGIIQFIPDNAPIIGNLDEAMATVFILNGLRVIGINIQALLPGGK